MNTQPATSPAAGTTTSAREILPVLLAADPYIPEAHDDEDDTDTTAVVLDDIATRAAHLHEYADLPPDADLLAGQDVPALIAAVRQFRAERDQFADRVDTLTAVAQGNKRHVQQLYADLQEAQRERDALQQRLDAVLALCDQEQRNATRWEQPLPVPEWVAAVRNAAALAGAEDGAA